MRLWIVLVALAFECVLHIHCYQISDFDILPKRFQVRSKALPIDDILYEANIRPRYFEEEDENETVPTINHLNSEEDEDLFDRFSEINEDDIKADIRDEEKESHSSVGVSSGFQYVSGGAGEAKQYLHPDGAVPNHEEIKSDEDLPAYCDPPNPCPIGYVGEDCDPRDFKEYTAEYSKLYQDQQNCMCDHDHNKCGDDLQTAAEQTTEQQLKGLISNMKNSNFKDTILPVVAKKSPRIRRDVNSISDKKVPQQQQLNILRKKVPLNHRGLQFKRVKKSAALF